MQRCATGGPYTPCRARERRTDITITRRFKRTERDIYRDASQTRARTRTAERWKQTVFSLSHFFGLPTNTKHTYTHTLSTGYRYTQQQYVVYIALASLSHQTSEIRPSNTWLHWTVKLSRRRVPQFFFNPLHRRYYLYTHSAKVDLLQCFARL